ncbi:MAG: UDP-2,3-diacylglucosamine diphosphatase [Proteobacteria bacterium]|nr:UDP-2,3-diacylglucosamine diphosphatase [Pseudomonadota bacterium]
MIKTIITENVVLCSDIHINDTQQEISESFYNWLEFVCIKAKNRPDWLMILGDLFDAWIGDDFLDHQCLGTYISKLTDILFSIKKSGTKIGIMHGNRDFLIGKVFCSKVGGELLPEKVLLKIKNSNFSYLLMHGDQLCTDDKDHQKFRSLVLSDTWKKNFLNKDIEERLKIAQELRNSSMRAKSKKSAGIMDVNLVESENQLNSTSAQTLIHGHTHRPGEFELPNGKKRIVLPDWRFVNKVSVGGGLLLDSSGVTHSSV